MAIMSRAFVFAANWFDQRTVHQTFEPLIADWQREWQDAPARRRWRVTIGGWLAFVAAVMVCSPRVLRTPVPITLTWRIVRKMSVVIAILVTLLTIPYFLDVGLRAPGLMLFGMFSA